MLYRFQEKTKVRHGILPSLRTPFLHGRKMPEVSVKIRAVSMIPAAFPPIGGKDRNMIKKYEDACKKAGLSEEQIKKIANVFEQDKSKLRYENSILKKKGYELFGLCEEKTNEIDLRFCVEDPGPSLDDLMIHKMELEHLRIELGLLSEEDRELLLVCFDPNISLREYSRKTGIDRYKILRRKEKLIKNLRQAMSEWIV